MPRSPAPSSSTMVCPLPELAEKWTPSPCRLRTAVLVAMIDSDAGLERLLWVSSEGTGARLG